MNLVEGLSREIGRVENMKSDAEDVIVENMERDAEDRADMAEMTEVNMGPYVAGCSVAIENGHRAIGSGDILSMKRAYEELADIN